MNFVDHSDLNGTHALFSGSQYHWINYTDDKLIETFKKMQAKERGTQLHNFAADCIKFNQKIATKPNKTLAMYVNDAIGFKMTPEQILYYSPDFYGCADAICFRRNFLRIHDLKTGETPAHMEQLRIYAALFCLEYDFNPGEIEMELRIYQNADILVENPTAEDIAPIMDKIVTFNKIIRHLKEEEIYNV